MASERVYINLGCGYAAPEGWLNIDASPTARIEKLPLVGGLLSRLSGNPEKFPAAVRYGDMTRPGLQPAGSVEAVYASHVLEHLPLEDMRKALRNIHAMLRPGGRLRVIVPDLEERARKYLALAGDPQAAHEFMESCYLGAQSSPKGLVGRARRVIGNSEHMWMFDQASMRAELVSAGFIDVRQARFGESGDAMFDRVENPDRFVDNGIEEVALDGFKRA